MPSTATATTQWQSRICASWSLTQHGRRSRLHSRTSTWQLSWHTSRQRPSTPRCLHLSCWHDHWKNFGKGTWQGLFRRCQGNTSYVHWNAIWDLLRQHVHNHRAHARVIPLMWVWLHRVFNCDTCNSSYVLIAIAASCMCAMEPWRSVLLLNKFLRGYRMLTASLSALCPTCPLFSIHLRFFPFICPQNGWTSACGWKQCFSNSTISSSFWSEVVWIHCTINWLYLVFMESTDGLFLVISAADKDSI